MVGPEKMIKKINYMKKNSLTISNLKHSQKKIEWNKKKSTKTKQKLYEPKMEYCKKKLIKSKKFL